MITSLSNDRIKHVASLISSKKERIATSTFVIEGTKLFMEAPIERIKEVYISEAFDERMAHGDASKLSGITLDAYHKLQKTGYEIVSDSVFKKMSDTVTPQGILCVVQIIPDILSDIIEKTKDRPVKMIALEGLQDPGNMGTILRTAEAAGIDLILAGMNTVDIYSSKVVRSTMGSIFRVPVVYTDALYKDIELIKSNNIKVYAAHLKGTEMFQDVKYSDRSMILIGNEGRGLTDEAASMADKLVKIPMEGKVESLNAAVAAALLMFELRR